MNKKTILNRTLPLIIALFVVIVVAVCVVLFSGDKKTPMVENKNEDYLTINLGYETPIKLTKGELYEKLKNSDSGLTFLVNELDNELLSKLGYTQKVTEEEIQKAIEEEIFGKDYEFDPENFDADQEKIESYLQKMFMAYGMNIKETSIQIQESALKVSLNGEDELKNYYTLSLARKAYARTKLGEDQKKAYEEYVKAFEEYLVDLYKYENDEVDTAPTTPTESSKIKISDVKTDFEKENADKYWSLIVTYATKAEAEKALLQVGVVNYGTSWYEYQGAIDLNDYKNENGEKKYSTLDSYYSEKGKRLNVYEMQLKLIELYNNSKNPNVDEFLKEGVHYTVEELTKEAYEALSDVTKGGKYSPIYDEEKKNILSYKGVVFKTEGMLDNEGNIDDENPVNALYFDNEKLNKLNSNIASYIKALSALYTEGRTEEYKLDRKGNLVYSTNKNTSMTTSIQSKGDYYILAMKLVTEEGYDVESDAGYGKFYDDEKYDKGIEESKLNELKVGYVDYTRDAEGNLVFTDEAYANSKYWAKVEELLDDAVSSTNINEYMAKLRVEFGLTIYDEKMESSYTSKYTSDYENTKKSNSSVVAKLNGENEDGVKVEFEVSAETLYAKLNKALGAITAIDTYQYHSILFQNQVVDYGKYLSGAKLDDCVVTTEYALANVGELTAATKWVKADTNAKAVFEDVTLGQFDVLVRKSVKGQEPVVEKLECEYTEQDGKVTVNVTDKFYAKDSYKDSEAKYESLDENIAAMKVALANGQYADYGFDASYGWKEFLKDFYSQYYGISVTNNDELKLYFIYEDTIQNITDALVKTNQESWNNFYLPYMQQQYDKYFSVDAIHFLISVKDADGNMSDPAAEDTAWTAEQKAAAEELYNKVYNILKKVKKSSQGSVLQEIVDAFDAAPKFVAGVEQTTKAQQEYVDNNELLVEKNEQGEIISREIEYTTTIRGYELELSKYKTLGLEVTYQDLGTVTADKMVENFENALKVMWNAQNNNDSGMQSGTALETNEFYQDYSKDEFLTTEFGYHVLIANKFTGRTVAINDATESKVKVPVTLPSFEDVLIYEEDGEEVNNLSEYAEKQIETFYSTVAKDFSSSYWYQLNTMLQLLEDIKGTKLQFVDSEAVAKIEKISKYYVDSYYASLTYISEGYDYAMDLMDIFNDAVAGFVNGNNNISYANLKTIKTVAEAAVAKVNVAELNGTETKDFNELKAEFDAAKVTFDGIVQE